MKEVIIRRPSENEAFIQYKPNLGELQTKLKSKHSLQFVIEYDVERDPNQPGNIQVLHFFQINSLLRSFGYKIEPLLQLLDGYFVHFIAPENLKPMPKHVVFIIDTSGSMRGKKMRQTKNALRTIISELREDQDYLTILTFSNDVKTWDGNGNVLVRADQSGKMAAMAYVEDLGAEGT